MLTGTTPSTHDGRLNVLAPGVDGGEFTGEMVMRSGAEPLSCDDAASPSSRDLPDVPPPSRLPVFLLPPRLRLRCRCSQLPRDDLELSLPPAAKSGSLVHLSCGHAVQPFVTPQSAHVTRIVYHGVILLEPYTVMHHVHFSLKH